MGCVGVGSKRQLETAPLGSLQSQRLCLRMDAFPKTFGKQGVSVCCGCRNRVPGLGGGLEPGHLLSQFYRLEVETVVSAELVPLYPPGLVDRRRLPSLPTLLPAVCLISYKDTRQNGLGWTLMASWYLNYVCKDRCPQIPSPSEVLGVRTSICRF